MAFTIQFQTEAEFTTALQLLKSIAQKNRFSESKYISADHDKKSILFLKSAMFSGILFPDFFRAMPNIKRKIDSDEKIHAQMREFKQREALGKKIHNRHINFTEDPINIYHNGGLSLRECDLNEESQEARVEPELQSATTILCEAPKSAVTKRQSNLPDEPDSLLVNLMRQHSMVVIGEKHNEVLPKYWIIQNLAKLKSEGLTTIYLG